MRLTLDSRAMSRRSGRCGSSPNPGVRVEAFVREPSALRRARLGLAAFGLALCVVGAARAGSASAHPGLVDPSGSHQCTAQQASDGVCAEPGYHRHSADGIEIAVPNSIGSTPTVAPPAEIRREQTPATLGTSGTGHAPQSGVATPPTTAAATAHVAPPSTTPLAQTGVADEPVAIGAALVGLGILLLTAQSRLPRPVVLERL